MEFQSTPSGGKATNRGRTYFGTFVVSIHAFRGEGDVCCSAARNCLGVSIHAFRGEGDQRTDRDLLQRAVSIHAFRGEGDLSDVYLHALAKFQSTPSGGKATRDSAAPAPTDSVSIHAFRGEGDFWRCPSCRVTLGFNPRLPGGRRLAGATGRGNIDAVSIHAFRGEGDIMTIGFWCKV